MSMDHQFRRMADECIAQLGCIDQPFEMPPSGAGQRMMNSYDAKQSFVGASIEQGCKTRDLLIAKNAGRRKRKGGGGARQADDHDRSAAAQEREGGTVHVIASHVIAPMQMGLSRAHIGIVIPRNYADVFG